ncbi:MAG: N-6 DNA methylase [Pirellulaceae bacterium]
MTRRIQQMEFGDFQTPPALAEQVCQLLVRRGVRPRSVLEPACGKGSFLLAASRTIPEVERLAGMEINPKYCSAARESLEQSPFKGKWEISTADFFELDWDSLVCELPQPVLVLGNPPWVTNSQLGSLNSTNLPDKSNHQNHRGIDAITGKSNFDISEFMLLRALDWLDGTTGSLAMLCKSTVARKVLRQAWQDGSKILSTDIFQIDAQAHFGAAVDACLLLMQLHPDGTNAECRVHSSLTADAGFSFGVCRERLVSDMAKFQRWQHLGGGPRGTWRSGIKHDCAQVMQLQRDGDGFRNGLGEYVELEPDYLYPLLKSSDLAKQSSPVPRRFVIVPQQFVGQPTEPICDHAPKTWQYLMSHGERLDRRASSIYRNRPRFSVFGVGDYSFSPWKVAIAGLYKQLNFRTIGPAENRPVVLDDTCYFCPCVDQCHAEQLLGELQSRAATEFLESQIFWDNKRPITAELLNQLNLAKLAEELEIADVANP